LNFDYTYAILFGLKFFEPMVIVTNFVLLLVSLYAFFKLIKFRTPYATHMARFIIIMGVSGCFGAAAHAMHYQMGKNIFDVVFFISNTMNLLAIYFCFRGSYNYSSLRVKPENKYILGIALAWVAALIVVALINNNFLLIKIHAGIVLVYSLVIHYLRYKKYGDKGSTAIVAGIGISFLSIIVHSLHFSFSEWFNYKDIAHVIMIVSLLIIYGGIRKNAKDFASTPKK